jgi:hypothetical protein
MYSQEKKSGILRKISNRELDEEYLNEYEFTYPTTGTFEKVKNIEGKVTVQVQSEEHCPDEGSAVLPVAQQREIEVEIIPDFDTVQYSYTGTVASQTKFTTVTKYTEVSYYTSSATLEYICVFGKKKHVSGKSSRKASTATESTCKSTSTSTRAGASNTATSTRVLEKIINFVRYIVTQERNYSTGSTETKVYSTSKPRTYPTIAVTTYIGTTLDTLVVNPKEVGASTKQFIFPSTVTKYCKSPYQYFIRTLQYCIDTCTVEELAEWVKGLYGNGTTRKWLYFINKYPRARHTLTGPDNLKPLVEALNTVFIFGFPLPIVKKSNLTGLPVPAFTNAKINKTVGTYFNFPVFKHTTTELQREYIEGLKAKEFSLLKFNTSIAQTQVDTYGYVNIKYAGKIICSQKKRYLEHLERDNKRVKTQGYVEQSAYV